MEPGVASTLALWQALGPTAYIPEPSCSELPLTGLRAVSTSSGHSTLGDIYFVPLLLSLSTPQLMEADVKGCEGRQPLHALKLAKSPALAFVQH